MTLLSIPRATFHVCISHILLCTLQSLKLKYMYNYVLTNTYLEEMKTNKFNTLKNF